MLLLLFLVPQGGSSWDAWDLVQGESCTKNGAFKADKNNCSKFFQVNIFFKEGLCINFKGEIFYFQQCVNDKWQPKECPPGLKFADPKQGSTVICDWPDAVECGARPGRKSPQNGESLEATGYFSLYGVPYHPLGLMIYQTGYSCDNEGYFSSVPGQCRAYFR